MPDLTNSRYQSNHINDQFATLQHVLLIPDMIYISWRGYEMSYTGDTADTLGDKFLLSLSAVELAYAYRRHKGLGVRCIIFSSFSLLEFTVDVTWKMHDPS